MTSQDNSKNSEMDELDKLVLDEFDNMEKEEQERDSRVNENFSSKIELDTSLNEKEREFVLKTVKWLKPKENRDDILAKIWRLLEDSSQESVFLNDEDQKINGPENVEAKENKQKEEENTKKM
jgi:hypothetical protein